MKMKLNLESLSVESFNTSDEPKVFGTINGYQESTNCGADSVYQCNPSPAYSAGQTACASCEATCGNTVCITACGGGGDLTNNTCDAKYNTCARTCQPEVQAVTV